MSRVNHPLRRRTILNTIGASVVGSSVLVGVSSAQTTINVPTDENTIEDAIAAANPGDTIEVEPGTYAENALVIDGLVNLTLSGAGSDEVTIESQSSGRGLTVHESSAVTLEGFTLRGAGGYGLKLQFADELRVEDVHAVENGRTGIDLNTTDTPTVVDVESRDNNGGFGVALRNLSEASVENIETTGNEWGGLALWPIDNDDNESEISAEITDSSFTGEPVGVLAQYQGDFDVLLEENDIEDNDTGVGISDQFGTVENAGGVTVTLNNITGNDVGVDNTGGGEELPATCNYWGHPTGPEHDDNPKNNPKGDVVNGNVDFQPWNTRRIGRGQNPANSCVGGEGNGQN
ncbi:right-handed parallel beta-helix repeat-containing protein [Haloarcula nitratireducens]|uniref:Right-handed parallel beta-helix repeat-containing protein n=1 Tax=Haloarcula nitratireducens TaxID=2487749 RepID=A0AAW4PIK0_9EURY|nr:right-handed parallel beta-helix repeat-containing protein [Halomicroarcula nitratireducens]MBX0297855.1 right-handed parallel beta-helix repeat-containing protein [Halomicroarcula nitratireducens]